MDKLAKLEEPTKYCWGCSYALVGLGENRCPECGRRFDPGSPRTFSPRPIAKKRAAVIVAIYLLPLPISLIWWVLLTQPWTGGTPPMHVRVLVGLWQACGLLAWVMLEMKATQPMAILTIFSVTWSAWLIAACTTGLRRFPYIVHLTLGFLWCFAGCPPTGLVIT